MDICTTYGNKLNDLCASHHVEQLYVFGSILHKSADEAEDIDMLIQFGQVDLSDYFTNYMDLKEKLEELFGKSVDLIENQSIRNPIFRQSVDRDKQLVYERKSA